MIINIVTGGPTGNLPDLKEYDEEGTIWIGVDKAVYTLLSFGIKPKVAFGDFDSVTEVQWKIIKKQVPDIRTFVKEKDETDTELALNWAIEQQPEKIRVFGATGGRLDHFLANIQLIVKALLMNLSFQIEMIDKKNIIYVCAPGKYHLTKMDGKKYISFFPISMEVKGLTLSGFKYPLTDRLISLGSTLCTSNELTQEFGTFSFTEGILMVVRSCD